MLIEHSFVLLKNCIPCSHFLLIGGYSISQTTTCFKQTNLMLPPGIPSSPRFFMFILEITELSLYGSTLIKNWVITWFGCSKTILSDHGTVQLLRSFTLIYSMFSSDKCTSFN